MEHKELTEKILCYLKSSLKETRYRHTIGVRDTAIVMAESEGADIEKAEIAALLHDMARNIPVPVMNRYIEYFNLPEKYKDNVNLAHGKIAAKLAEAEFNITDSDILDAVCYHTTGRAGMSLLEKIIFLADAIEPGRDYPGLDDIRAKADENLDKGCLESLKRTIEFLNEKGVPIDKDTIEAFDYINRRKYMNEQRERAEIIARVLSDNKGIDVDIIDISPKASFADYFVLASGGTDRQVAALVEHVEDLMEPQGIFPKNVEGRKSSGWILMDYGDVVVNVMTLEMREKYNIEKIWGDCDITGIE